MAEAHRLPARQGAFSLQTAGRPMTRIFPQWVQDLALLIESVEAVRPAGALPDWQPGATVRLPYSRKVCSDGAAVCTQALMSGGYRHGAGLFGRLGRLPAHDV